MHEEIGKGTLQNTMWSKECKGQGVHTAKPKGDYDPVNAINDSWKKKVKIDEDKSFPMQADHTVVNTDKRGTTNLLDFLWEENISMALKQETWIEIS